MKALRDQLLSLGNTRDDSGNYLFSGTRVTTPAFAEDADGKVGRSYGARTTPHMYVIDPSGTLLYVGAIDDKRSTNQADIKTATNYVTQAFAEIRAGKPVSAASTNAYGCTVKY